MTVGITAQQSLEISHVALGLGDITAATEWFQIAHSKSVNANAESGPDSIPISELTDAWDKTYKEVSRTKEFYQTFH